MCRSNWWCQHLRSSFSWSLSTRLSPLAEQVLSGAVRHKPIESAPKTPQQSCQKVTWGRYRGYLAVKKKVTRTPTSHCTEQSPTPFVCAMAPLKERPSSPSSESDSGGTMAPTLVSTRERKYRSGSSKCSRRIRTRRNSNASSSEARRLSGSSFQAEHQVDAGDSLQDLTLEDAPEGQSTGLEDVDDSSFFFYDTATQPLGEKALIKSDTKLVSQEGDPSAPAWEDSDDERLLISPR